MKLSDVINEKWLDASSLKNAYEIAHPFPHIVMDNFIKQDILKPVSDEFPDLSKMKDTVVKFQDEKQIKFAGKGMQVLSPSALHLNSYLQSDLMMNWLNEISGIKEPLISDPYLSGGGYHEIKPGGLLKVHADFNKHPTLDLDRRLNLLIYLNEGWEDAWGGAFQLFERNMERAGQEILPRFNTAVIFTTTSFTYHGHPDPLNCPENRSRRSLAYYYFSTGRPELEVSANSHSTLFKERKGEKFTHSFNYKGLLKDLTPPIILKTVKKILKK
jgi:Rps23 Pro-64 3,4-dihydroxylase Tpa1-like proline 4-hydroxylase